MGQDGNHRESLPQSFSPAQRRGAWAVSIVLVLAVFAVFGWTVRFDFVNFDDDICVYENPRVSNGLTKQGVVWAFTTSRARTWQPLTWLSLMADRDVFDRLPGWLHLTLPGWYHFTNVLLHAVASVLLFLVLRQMTGRLWPAAVVAGLFALHPLRAESVAWVTERKDVLSGVFFMLLLGAYAAYARRAFSLLRYAAVVALLALGLMAKPVLVTAPCVLLLLDFWPLGRLAGGKNPGRLVLEKIPLLALAGGCCVLTLWAQGDALISADQSPWSWRIGNALLSYVDYLGRFFYPANLAVAYPRRNLDLPAWQVAAAAALLAGVTAAALAAGRKYPYGVVGWFWYLGMMLPMIGLVQLGAEAEPDRFTYLPQIGICIALVWAAADATRRVGTVPIFVAGHHAKRGRHENGTVPLARPRWRLQTAFCGLASAAVLAALAVCAWCQTSYWRNSETLWNRTLACNGRNPIAQGNLGLALAHQGRIGEAIDEFHNALKINPDDSVVHRHLGVALGGLGQIDAAVAEFRRALGIHPRDASAHANLGAALATLGRLREAAAEYESALKFDPDAIVACISLAWIRATHPDPKLRDGAEAVALAERAVELVSGDPDALDALAAAEAEAGRFSAATATAGRAGELARRQGKTALAAAVQTRLALYQAGKPFREPAWAAGGQPAPPVK
jgi:tetratricopeptide (TPR) repeat protein